MRDTGILTIYKLQNTAAAGMMPTEQLVKVDTAYYSERTVTYSRLYAAMGADCQIDKLVRCFNTDTAERDEYVVLEDGKQYRIASAQKIIEVDATDLTLVRVEDYLNVAE